MDSLRCNYADPQLVILAPLAGTPIHQQHKENLFLHDEDADSDMSYRGWDQGTEEKKMIAEHPDIFPNFYSVPTPFLDHEFLKELRDFLLNGTRTARPLLLELRLAGADMLSVFEDWRAWRQNGKAGLARDDLAAYYAGDSFPHDLLEFVETQYLSQSKVAGNGPA
jgi:hypothetical protein